MIFAYFSTFRLLFVIISDKNTKAVPFGNVGTAFAFTKKGERNEKNENH